MAGCVGFQPVLVKTDHRSLKNWVSENIDTPSGPRGRRARWHETLSQFNLEVQYIPGKDNTVADTMSRFAYPASSSREDVSFHRSARADAEVRKLIEQEIAEGNMIGMIRLGRTTTRGHSQMVICALLQQVNSSLWTHNYRPDQWPLPNQWRAKYQW